MKEEIFQTILNERLSRFTDNLAIEYSHKSMTYAALDRRSNVIANYMINKGIKKGTFVGILMENRMGLISTIIGILKAGCVIVPLYPAYPDKRLEIMIHSTNLKYIFIDGVNASRWETGKVRENCEFLFINEILSNPEVLKFVARPGVSYSPEDKLYIHFTSGSTGIPRAIIGKNKSLLHFILWEIECFNITPDFRVAQFTIPGFDPFLRDVFAPLLAGGVICIPGKEDILVDAVELKEWVDSRRITLIHCVSSLFRLLSSGHLTPGHFKGLKYIMLAGEKINPGDLIHWYDAFGERIKLANCYGPTETTMSKACYFIQKTDVKRDRIPIGKPITGSRIFILDEEMNRCDPLEVGEIYIRTDYRSWGYYDNPRLNKEKFIQAPFSDDPGDILYKSGDLGRILLDGNIDILGRVDRQVKIRGYRVELEEIEAALTRHPSVKEAVVIKKESSAANEMLYTYITITAGEEQVKNDEALTQQLKEYLLEKLPGYMVPAVIRRIDKIPRGARGKVDYNSLIGLFPDNSTNYIPPRDDIEKRLSKLWSDSLGIEKIGIYEGFIQLGGNSLNMMTLISKIHREFDIRLSLGEIFKNQTLEKQAEIIRRAEQERYTSIEKTEEKEYYPLSSAQKRIYILQQMEIDNVSYNIFKVLILAGEINKRRLETTFLALIERHESLRTSFEIVKGEPLQKINHQVTFALEYFNLNDSKRKEEIINDFLRYFDLSRAPLLRVGLITVEKTTHLLLVDIHHITADAFSLELVVKEFMTLYEGRALPPLRLQYKDYSQWLNRENPGNRVKWQAEYWLNRFKGEIPLLDLPTDYPRDSIQDFTGDMVMFVLEPELTEKIRNVIFETETTCYMVLLAIFNILLSKYTDHEDIVVGTPILGRRHADLQHIIGIFVNMLPMRNFPGKNKIVGEFFEEVRENTLNAYENQDYHFEELVKKLGLKVEPGRNPLFDAAFNFINVEKEKESWEGIKNLTITPYGAEHKTSKYDLVLRATEGMDRINLSLEYSRALFEKRTIEKMAAHYVEIVDQVVKNREIKLKDIVFSYDIVFAQNKSQEDEIEFNF